MLHGCKSMGLHTALDTSGYLGHLADDELLADVDLVLLDIKAATGRRCRSLTGAEPKPTIQFAEDLAAINKAVWLRYVLVPGLTDRLDEIASLATLPPGWATSSASMCRLSQAGRAQMARSRPGLPAGACPTALTRVARAGA